MADPKYVAENWDASEPAMEVFKDGKAKICPRYERDNHNKEGKGEDPHNKFAFFGIFGDGFEVNSFKSGGNSGVIFIFTSFDLFGVVHSINYGRDEHEDKDNTLNPKNTTKLDIIMTGMIKA